VIFDKPLKMLVLSLTGRCNFACKYCYAEAHPQDMMSLDTAVPESLFESILFGTVKGSFTGAQNLQGVFEQAGNGTLFLDEINSMPMAMQAKLLRALQEKVVRRVGATYEIPVKCRIITSSNEEPEACVEKGTLRRDIYYRLALLRINIPPLREREKDLEVLAEYFLKKKSRLYGKKNIKLSTEFSNYLYQRPWPGNVRELEHTLESCVAMIEDGEELQLCHLPSHLKRTKIIHNRYQTTSTNNDLLNNIQATTLAAALREVEKKVILNSLQNHHWNICFCCNWYSRILFWHIPILYNVYNYQFNLGRGCYTYFLGRPY
jgi:arginine utilization regulatory protein